MMSNRKGAILGVLLMALIITGFGIIGNACSQPSTSNTKATANIWKLQQEGIIYAGNIDVYRDGLKEVEQLHKKPGNYTVDEVIDLGDRYHVQNNIDINQ